MICRRLSLLPVVVPLLAACGIFGGSDDEESAPAELIKFDSSIRVSRLWSVKLSDDAEHLLLGLRPATDGDVMYAAAHDGRIVALNLQTGERIWQVDTELPHSLTSRRNTRSMMICRRLSLLPVVVPLLAACGIFGGSDDEESAPAELIKFDSSIRVSRLWSVKLSDDAEHLLLGLRPATDGDVMYAAAHDGRIVALNLQTGERIWQVDTECQEFYAATGDTESARLEYGLALADFNAGVIDRNFVQMKLDALPVSTAVVKTPDIPEDADPESMPAVVEETPGQ